MKRLPLAEELVARVLAGDKTSTVRLGKRNYEIGDATFVSRSTEIPVKITDITFSKIRDLDERIAQRDGYATLQDLLQDLTKYYPNIAPDDEVTIIGFLRHELDQSQD